MLLGKRMRWVAVVGVVGVLATSAVASAQQPPKAPAGSDAQVGFKRNAQLTPRQQLAEAQRMMSFMEAGAADIRAMLEKARAKRDVVKSLGLNDKLSRLDAIIRTARERKAALQAAVEALHGRGETGWPTSLLLPAHPRGRFEEVRQAMSKANAKQSRPDLQDPQAGGGASASSLPTSTNVLIELANHEYMILVVLYTQAQQVIAEANQVIGEEAAYFGATVVELNIDPTLGPGDEATYGNTDVTIVAAPPISATPSQ